jgi:pimeloyl-ACP methyl ester carboxylesterase
MQVKVIQSPRSLEGRATMSNPVNTRRRRLLGTTIASVGLLDLGLAELVHAQPSPSTSNASSAGLANPFGALHQIDAGVLNIGYADLGPKDGPAVILLHGWPYDIQSYADVAPRLAAKGYRVLIPYARGYGDTRFLSAKTPRNAEPAALASDVVDFMDALRIKRAVIGGFDWGARSADIVAALWPERVKALVSVSGYLIGSQAAGKLPLPPEAELQWWYQYYFATERGRAGYDRYRREFARLIWRTASPSWLQLALPPLPGRVAQARNPGCRTGPRQRRESPCPGSDGGDCRSSF